MQHMAETCEVAPWLKALPCAPEFRPSEAEFADPIAYISKIEAEARTYGICKIVPPYSRASRKTVMANLNRSLLLQSPDSVSSAAVHGTPASHSEPELCRNMGGCMPPQVGRRSMSGCCPSSQPRTRSTPLPLFTDAGDLKARFNTRRQQLGCSSGKRSKVPVQTLAQKLVWQSGESYTLEQFEAKAKQFTRARLKTARELPPFIIESLFWKAAADRTITVEYGNDIPGSAFGEPSQQANVTLATTTKRKRGLEEEEHVQQRLKEPKLRVTEENTEPQQGTDDSTVLHRSLETALSSGTSSKGKLYSPLDAKESLRSRRKNGPADGEGRAGSKLANSCWNMKVIARSPGSLLKYMPDEVPGVTSPMVYIGMLFSWFAWHIEDHELHSLNYLHTGAPKTWYAVPGDAAPALEEVVRVYGYGNISDPKAAFALLGEKTTVMSPEVLLVAGVPCCRLVQNAGEFVVTFPRAYHLGFSHGFNCGEAANFASPAWLEVAKEAATRRAAMDYLPMLSHQQLLYLLALSFCPRIPCSLPSEFQMLELNDSLRSSGEDAVKKVFTNDVAHNNRLLGLLVESGVTGCILLGDGADLTPALSEHFNNISKLKADNDLKISHFMCDMLLEEVAYETKTVKEDVAASPKEQDSYNSPAETGHIPTITNSSFRWGTLPCAACGLLCFPSVAVVQPVSKIESGLYPAKHLNIGASGHLSSFFTVEEGHAPDSGHLLSSLTKNNEELQSEFVKTSFTGAVCYPVTSLAHAKPEQQKFLQWKVEQDEKKASHRNAQDTETLRQTLQVIQADQKYKVCEKNEYSCSHGKLLDHLQGEIRKTNVLWQDSDRTQEFISNCEEEMPCKAVITQASTELDSNKIGLVLPADEALHNESARNVDLSHFSSADSLAVSNADLLKNVTEDGPLTAGTGNIQSRSSGSTLQKCEHSPRFNNLLLLDEVGATVERNVQHDTTASVLQLLAVTYQEESEDSGLPDSNTKFAVVEAEHGGICFHPHSSVVTDDEVGCTVDAPWHYMKEAVDCAPSLGCIDELLTNNSSVATPLNELDKFVCKEVLLQSDNGTYVITECMPKVEAGLLVHNDQNCRLQSSESESKGASTAMGLESLLPSLQKEESSICLGGGQSCLEKRESFVESEKAVQVQFQVFKEPTVSKVESNGESKEILFSIPTTESSAMSHDNCKLCEATGVVKSLNQVKCFQSSNRLNTDKFGQTCLLGLGNTSSTTENMRIESQLATDGINKADDLVADDRTDLETMCKASLSVDECFPPDCIMSRLNVHHLPTNPVGECSRSLNWMQGEQRNQARFSLIEGMSNLNTGNDKLIRGHDNRMKREVEAPVGTNADLLKTSASIGDSLCCNKSCDNRLDSLNTLPRPRFLCLEHALEARHQLKLLGGSYMAIICPSDIGKIEDCAQHFAEELNLSHSWRGIPFKEANQEEKNLINMALNTGEEGEDSSKDWVVQLGMSVRHCRDKVWSNHYNGLYSEHGIDVSCKVKAGLSDVRDNCARGRVSKEKKTSVVGHWCGKVWMNNQVHPVLGGCYTAPTPLQAFNLSVEDNSINEKTSSPEQVCTGDVKDEVEGVKVTCQAMHDVDTGPNSECELVPQRPNKKRKSIDLTGTLLKTESEFASEGYREARRVLATGIASLDTSCLSSSIKKASISLNEIADLDNEGTRKRFHTMESNMHTATEITNTKPGNDHVSDMTGIDHDGSYVDIWQDLDVGCYSQEVLSLDNIAGVTDTLMVDNCHQMDVESEENVLIPAMLRRRSCSVFDGEAQSQLLGRERDCAVSALPECTIGEALHAVLEPSIADSLDCITSLKRKQNKQTDIINRRAKEQNFKPLDISNLATADFGQSTLESEQGIPFFEPSRNFTVGLGGEENGGGECVCMDSILHGKVQMPHCNIKQECPHETGQFSSVPTFEILTKTLGRMNSDSSSGSTQWRLHTAQNCLPLVKCNSKKLAGKSGRQLRKQVNWEKSHKDPLNQSLHAMDSSDGDIVHKRTLSKGRKKIVLDDLPFDCADFFGEGPSTRLRSRRVAKAFSMDDDDAINRRHDDALMGSGRKHKKPRQRARKPIMKDIEDECGAYICDLDGCSMSFSSKQELNLHKKNACTFTGCGKRFGSHKYLLQHKRVHLDDRPLKCPWNGCKMTFKWKWACTEHYRVHTGERPYVCPIAECGRTFRFVSDFSRHKRKTGHTK